jgi:hypothetical protein
MPDEAQDQSGPQGPVYAEELDGNGVDFAGGEELRDAGDLADASADGYSEVLPEPEIAFSWQASEYVHHHKGTAWYGGLFAIIAVLIGVAAWLHSWLEIGVFIAMCGVIVVYARKPPRTLLYELSENGIQIDRKAYPFSEFRSFAVMRDDEWHSIDLEPTRRLSPRVVLLFDPEDFEVIVGHLEMHLPREDRDWDIIETITRYLRF